MHFQNKLFISCGVILVLMNLVINVTSVTRQQIKNHGKRVKKTCMPKNNVTEDQVGKIEQGKFLKERNVMCYIACVYTESKFIKNNKFEYDEIISTVDRWFPKEMKAAVKAAIQKCRGVAKNYIDICKAAYWTAKCMYQADPANFVFP